MEFWAVGLVLVLGLGLLWAVKGIGNTITQRARARGSARTRARRHFIKAAQLLSDAKVGAQQGNGNAGRSGCREAVKEAEAAIALDPKDAAAYIVKGLALEHLGQPTAALRCLSMALTPPAARSLAPQERADALSKRAGMLLDQSRGKKSLQAAIADLEESSGLQPRNEQVLCVLGGCYERRGTAFCGQALQAYQKVLAINPRNREALTALDRLQSVLAPGSRRSS